jgi:hypothetical protein
MILSTDIQTDWSPEDVALFAATVGAVQKAIKETAIKYGRENDAILQLVSKAALVAAKGLIIETGMQVDRSSVPAFTAYAELLTQEVRMCKTQCQHFESELVYSGRA